MSILEQVAANIFIADSKASEKRYQTRLYEAVHWTFVKHKNEYKTLVARLALGNILPKNIKTVFNFQTGFNFQVSVVLIVTLQH